MKSKKYILKNTGVFKGYSVFWLEKHIDNKSLYKDETIYILNFKQITNYIATRTIPDSCLTVRVNHAFAGSLKSMKKGDIVLSVVGRIDKIEALYVDFEPEEYIIYDDTSIIIRNENTDYNSEFIYMMFSRTSIKNKLLQQRNLKKRKNAMPRLTIKILTDLEIPIPDEAEMKELLRIHHRLQEEEKKLVERNMIYDKALDEYLGNAKIQIEELLHKIG